MPETIKPEDQDEDQGHESSDMPLAYPEIAHAAEGEAASAEPPDRSDAAGAAVSGDSLIEPEAYAFEHTATEEAPLLATEEEPEDFAASVVSGLEQLEIEEREAFELAEEAPTAGQASEDAFFTGWDGLDIPEEELSEGYQSALMPDHDPALRTLSEISLASASLLSGFSAAPAPEAGKHDELADAVQAALLSVYGTAERQEAPAYKGLSFREDMLAWQTPQPSQPSSQSEALDGLSPQEVILNYFDYNPASSYTNGRSNDAIEPQEEPAWRRPAPGASPEQYGRGFEARLPAEVPAPAVPAPVYDTAPVYHLPVAPISQSRAVGSPERENSRLLGAAAIGLIGGIAIAASLAAFLIYGGPHQATFEIPGVGNFRLDKDDQGYGRQAPEEGVSETGKSSQARPVPEFTSEVLAADAMTLPGQPVPLSISIRSPQPFERTLVSITGIPEGGRLSAGIDAGGGNWLLPPRRLSGLTLSLPAGLPEIIPLEVQLLDSNVRTPLSAKNQFVVRMKPVPAPAAAMVQNTVPASPFPVTEVKPVPPAPAPVFALSAQPPAQAAFAATLAPSPVEQSPAPAETSFKTQTVKAAASPAPFQASLAPGLAPSPTSAIAPRRGTPRPEVEDLIREGNKRMREGDILEARQFYQKAVAYGDPEAALAMGRSFDPIYFARIDKKNAEPDAAKAFDWYRRAMDAGAAQTAMVRIENLKHFLNE